jgi:uncharacterized C2H2 Zn-finger protein
MAEYIYLLQEREFIKTNENIYKIGKTKQKNLKRICNYNNGTILICQLKCNDCNKLERKIIKLFKEKYELQKDIGYEYFKGNCNDMRDDICNYIKNENTIDDISECEEEYSHDYDLKENGNKNKSFIYNCVFCNYNTNRKYDLKRHHNALHNNILLNAKEEEKNKFNCCSKCNKEYKTKKYLINHEEKCNGLNILTCPKCMKTFSSRGNKSKHIKKNNCKAKSIINAVNEDIKYNIY